jgi:4-amino-4-deoxy-L-arabinose transferase-like glycosyltransferase
MLICGAVATALYLPALGRPALWEPDEGRYAEIAREMTISGDWITPRNNFVRYFEKPPLAYWLTALSFEIFGKNEFAARIPAAVFSIGQVALIEWFGEVIFGAGTGLASALCLGLSPVFFGFARFITLDPALAFLITAALALFHRASATEGFRSRAAQAQMMGVAALTALGTLTKGPVAIVMVTIIAIVYLIAEHRSRDLTRIPWVACAAVYLAITAPWFVLVSIRNRGFLSFFFLHEHLQRYLSSGEHSWGPWFFVAVVAAGMWPWIFFAAFSRDGFPSRAHLADPTTNARSASSVRFLLIWFATVFIFFSFPRSKLGSYILPGLPPLAILCGLGIVRLTTLDVRQRSRCFGWLAAASLVLATGVSIALAIAVEKQATVHAPATDLIVSVSLMAIGSTGAFVLSRSSLTAVPAIGALAVGVVVALFAGTKAREDAASLDSYRSLARAIEPCVQAGCTLASYHHFVQGLPFYTGVREALVGYRGELAPFGDLPDASGSFIESESKLAELWRDRCVVLIANRRDIGALQRLLAPAPQPIAAEGKKLALTNRADCLR